jgi:hypothetical protein
VLKKMTREYLIRYSVALLFVLIILTGCFTESSETGEDGVREEETGGGSNDADSRTDDQDNGDGHSGGDDEPGQGSDVHDPGGDIPRGFALADSFSLAYSPSDQDIRNPERGFYSFVELLRERDFNYVRTRGHSLVFSYIRLDDYRDRPIPPSLLNDLSAGFAAIRSFGLKVIPRFSYNFGPWPDSEPDAAREWVLHHIEQVRPVLQANADVIAVLQAGFIGAWGEWHASTNGLLNDQQDWQDILHALLGAVPADRMVQLRYPLHKGAMFTQPLQAEEAYSLLPKARIAHHNDCFLASETDEGTYPSPEIEYWKRYLEQDTSYVVMGGETCKPSSRSDCGTALEEMDRLNFSFLNSDYHPEVLSAWEDQGCYEEISRHLGYRFEMVSAELPRTVRPGGRFRAEISISNTGFAAPYNPRPLWLVVTGQGGHYEVELRSTEVRHWLPGPIHTVEVTLQLPNDIPEGEYDFGLLLPDPHAELRNQAAYAIRLTNAEAWDPSTGYNRLTRIRIDDSGAGDRDSSAGSFCLWPEGSRPGHL